eukprot:103491_1
MRRSARLRNRNARNESDDDHDSTASITSSDNDASNASSDNDASNASSDNDASNVSSDNDSNDEESSSNENDSDSNDGGSNDESSNDSNDSDSSSEDGDKHKLTKEESYFNFGGVKKQYYWNLETEDSNVWLDMKSIKKSTRDGHFTVDDLTVIGGLVKYGHVMVYGTASGFTQDLRQFSENLIWLKKHKAKEGMGHFCLESLLGVHQWFDPLTVRKRKVFEGRNDAGQLDEALADWDFPPKPQKQTKPRAGHKNKKGKKGKKMKANDDLYGSEPELSDSSELISGIHLISIKSKRNKLKKKNRKKVKARRKRKKKENGKKIQKIMLLCCKIYSKMCVG